MEERDGRNKTSRADKEGIWWYLNDNFRQFSIKKRDVGTH